MALFDTALDTELQNVVNNIVIPIPSQLIKKIMMKLKLDSSDFLYEKKPTRIFFA